MTLYVLDTDHVTLHQRQHPALHRRLAAVSEQDLAVTIVTAEEYLARRNDFWLTYGQIPVAVLLLIVVTVLLLTKTIDPDAGLPILSGIAGLAIAKGSGGGRGATPRLPQDEQ